MHRLTQLPFSHDHDRWNITGEVFECIYCGMVFTSLEEADEDGCEWIVPPEPKPSGVDAWFDTNPTRKELVERYNDDKPAQLIEVLIEPQEDPYMGFDQMNGNWGLKRRSVPMWRWRQQQARRIKIKIRNALASDRPSFCED